ncbi:EAL domain-containing protein [Bacillus solitudinis]|uniref:EAL domain-containing protein n=1 Tax=Bacillus solitudinis TaxID=2014074 RepID=UPI000C232EBA|nr:EAL domain-containing protein [Bacillus solitudinis]
MIEKRDYISESKLFCKEVAMDSKEIPNPEVILCEAELQDKRQQYEEILSVVEFFGEKILNSLKGVPLLLSVSDNEGFILYMMGDPTIMKTVNDLGIKSGIQFTEQAMGTNVVNTSLKYNKQPIEIVGSEHYHEYLFQTACYAVAFHDTESDLLLGSIIIMTSIKFENPLMTTMLSTTVDSIERELTLRKQNRKLNVFNQIMMDNTQNLIIMTDKQGTITECSDLNQMLLDMEQKDIIGKSINYFSLLSPYISEVLKNGNSFQDIQLELTQKSKKRLICLFDSFPIYENGKLIGAFGQFRNITERYVAEERYNYLANHDELTGLPNRRYYKQRISALIQEQPKFAVLYLDLDRFKLINDTLGHSKGDLFLKQMAMRLKECVNSEDLISRMGGDEFMLLFPNIGSECEVVKKVEQVLSIFRAPILMEGYEFHITASIGIALYPQSGKDMDELMNYADTAMYKAKLRGKNQYAIYSEEMQTKSREKVVMENALRKAIDKEEFIVYVQPQINIKTGEVKGFETLIRWQHPERGLLSPSEFIPLAEETNLIIKIDQWMLRKACEYNKKWQQQGFSDCRIAVNLSSNQFSSECLVDVVKGVLEETGLEAKYLELEITETMTLDVEHTIPTLRKLRDFGVQISIDDFGTGYSSMNYLKKFSINRLKIDRSFVRDISSDSNDSDIVATIISMAHNLGVEVIAEGVEEKEQLRFLQFLKCDEVQGYYFSKPLPAEEIESTFRELQKLVKIKY